MSFNDSNQIIKINWTVRRKLFSVQLLATPKDNRKQYSIISNHKYFLFRYY